MKRKSNTNTNLSWNLFMNMTHVFGVFVRLGLKIDKEAPYCVGGGSSIRIVVIVSSFWNGISLIGKSLVNEAKV